MKEVKKDYFKSVFIGDFEFKIHILVDGKHLRAIFLGYEIINLESLTGFSPRVSVSDLKDAVLCFLLKNSAIDPDDIRG